MNNKKFYIRIRHDYFIDFTFFQCPPPIQQIKPADLKNGNFSLIVGNRRGPSSGTNSTISGIVKENEADFSHTKSFPLTKVVSVDIGALPDKQGFQHIKADWLELKVPSNSVSNILFEWFPSCMLDTWQRLLYDAVKKGFDCLRPDGQLFVDLQPYTCTLPSDPETALRDYLEEKRLEMVGKAGFTLVSPEKRTAGVCSRLMQNYDPFTMHFSRNEKLQILEEFLTKIGEYVDLGSDFQPDKATNLDAAEAAITYLTTIFKTSKEALYKQIGDELNNPDTTVATSSPEYLMFEWIYGMLSRKQGMLKALIDMGYKDPESTYYGVNPFNGRCHAWIISATKSTTPAETK